MATPRYSPQAIAAAERLVRTSTRNPDWKYQNGQWFTITLRNGSPRRTNALPFQAARFNSYLQSYADVYPLPAPPAPAPPASAGAQLRGWAGARVGAARQGVSNSVTGAIGGAVGNVLGAPGRLVRNVAGGLMGGLAALPGRLASSALNGALGLGKAALGAFIQAVKSSQEALLSYAKNVTSISDQTGAGRGLSRNIVNKFGALGVSSERTAAIFGNRNMAPELFNARAASLGAPKIQDANFGEKLARWFQSQAQKGLGGFLSARAKLDALFGGDASPEVLRIANSRPEILQKEAQFGARVQSSLGINDDVVRRSSEDLPLLQNRVSGFIESVKIKFGAELLPTLETAFGVISNVLLKNADGISQALQNAGRWIFVEGPTVALNAAGMLLNVMEGLSNGFFATAQGALGLLRAFGNKEGPIYQVMATAASFWDFMSEFAAQTKAVTHFIAAVILNMVAELFNMPGIKQIAEKANPQLAAALQKYTDPVKEYQDTLTATRPASSARGALDAAVTQFGNSGTVDRLESTLGTAKNASDAAFKTAKSTRDDIQAQVGTSEQRAQQWHNEKLKELRGIKKGTESTVQAISDQNGKPIVLGRSILDGIGADIALQQFRMASRMSG